MRSFASAMAMLLLAAPAAFPQPQRDIKTNCDRQVCTVAVDLGISKLDQVITGAPYSGRQDTQPVTRTMLNGTHTTVEQPPGLMTYRDSKGRVRTDRPVLVLRLAPGRPDVQSPDNSVFADIQDPVAGYRYILDPVNRVAHRLPLQSSPPVVWNAASTAVASTPETQTTPGGGAWTREPLGTKEISGVAAVGDRTTHVGPASNPMTHIQENWIDPRNGVYLVVSTRPNGDIMTMTMDDYSAAEPDPALFRIPDGYRVVDETGPFKIVHPSANADVSMGGGPQDGVRLASRDCVDHSSCTLTFVPGNGVEAMFTGAPYSGLQGSPANPPQWRTMTYRDSQGRLRTEKAAFQTPGRTPPANFTVVNIQDPVTGSFYVLDSVNHVAHRMPLHRGAMPLPTATAASYMGQVGTPGGTVTKEDLGTQIISGVSAYGIRTTTIHPPGTFNGNDATITQIAERWVDPKTNVVLLSKDSAPRGDFTITVDNYSTAEPDPSLFQIPKGYRVVDEAGSFNIVIPAAN